MTYRVRIAPAAKTDLYNAALWWADHHDLDQALRWMEGFEDAINSLYDDPERHPIADENDNFAVHLRQILYGIGKRKTHRAVFEVSGNDVVVRGIRHLAQRELTPDDL